MAIYDMNGAPLTAAYTMDGKRLTTVYNKAGKPLCADKTALRVMTYNVGGWYIGSGTNVPAAEDEAYYTLQNGMIQRADPDVLVIQEYWDTFSKAGRTARSMLEQYFPYIETRNGGGGYFGRAICSKYPISDYTQRAFTNETNRYFDSCTITVDSVPITVATTHFGLTLANRQTQLTQLLAFLQTQERFIIGGDFNTFEAKDTSGEDYVAILKPLVDAGFNLANCADFGFFETTVEGTDKAAAVANGKNVMCLDNIVTSGNIAIGNVYMDETKLTDDISAYVDHMPVIADLIV